MDGGRITKKYVLLICFTTVLLTVLYLSPQFILSSVTAVKTAAVKKTDIKAKVSCSGTIQTNQQQCIYYNMALKPKKIRIKIGDTVKTGQRLLDIDQEETVEAFSNRNLNDSVQQVQNTNGDDYSSYAGKLSSGQIDPPSTIRSSAIIRTVRPNPCRPFPRPMRKIRKSRRILIRRFPALSQP